MLLSLAHANQNDVNAIINHRDSRTPLQLAASLGNLAIAQLLIWVSKENAPGPGRIDGHYFSHMVPIRTYKHPNKNAPQRTPCVKITRTHWMGSGGSC